MATTPNPPVDELAAAQLDDVDAHVLAVLASVHDRLDPVPPGLVERIQFGITLDALHAEIAALQRTGELTGVRADETTGAQTVTFTSTSLTTMVTITPTVADRVRVDGWIAPGAEIDVELRLVGGSRHTVADVDGRFVFEDVPRGLAQFMLRRPGSPPPPAVLTPSIEL